jgi:hypothetical protein
MPSWQTVPAATALNAGPVNYLPSAIKKTDIIALDYARTDNLPVKY